MGHVATFSYLLRVLPASPTPSKLPHVQQKLDGVAWPKCCVFVAGHFHPRVSAECGIRELTISYALDENGRTALKPPRETSPNHTEYIKIRPNHQTPGLARGGEWTPAMDTLTSFQGKKETPGIRGAG